MTVLSKLDELNQKTEKQLIKLTSHEVDLGIRAALGALISVDNARSAENNYRTAQLACEEATRLIALLSPRREHGLESRLERLRKMLGIFSGETANASEDAVADLARTMWEARGCPEGVPEEDWFRAERALKARTELAACAGR
jgi:hypothetical protein